MSANTVNSALCAKGYDTKIKVCGHGFRAMAYGAMSESGLCSDDAIECKLSHLEHNNVCSIYSYLGALRRASINGPMVG